MNKELEALYRMQTPQFDEEYFLIKSALERKEKLEKAWEIVKNKRVDIADVITLSLEDYNERNLKVWQLTETEFNLLKEMLEEK